MESAERKIEANFTFSLEGARYRVKLHSPWTETYERLRGAEEVVKADASDEMKLRTLLRIFSPEIYQFDVYKVTEIEDAIPR